MSVLILKHEYARFLGKLNSAIGSGFSLKPALYSRLVLFCVHMYLNRVRFLNSSYSFNMLEALVLFSYVYHKRFSFTARLYVRLEDVYNH